MNLKFLIIAGLISVVIIVILRNDINDVDYPKEVAEDKEVLTGREDVEDGKGKLVGKVESSSGPRASPEAEEAYVPVESNVDRRGQAQHEIEALFETLMSNPDNRMEGKTRDTHQNTTKSLGWRKEIA